MTDRDRFRVALARRPLLLDAGMGTRLVARGLTLRRDDPALWNLSRPEDVLAIHRRDVDAGADAVLTNTFGANRHWLDRFGRAGEVEAINRTAVALAREAAGPDRFVLGSIGPSAVPDRKHDPAKRAALLEQVDLLAEAGVDALLLETQSSRSRLDVAELGERTGLPVLVSFVQWSGSEPAALAARLRDAGAAAIGCNCQQGFAPMLWFARAFRRVTGLPLLIKPSAAPRLDDPSRAVSDPPPFFFTAAVPELLATGVRLFGGCCGTTEVHIAALRTGLVAAGYDPLAGNGMDASGPPRIPT